jgi:hypothetical protein
MSQAESVDQGDNRVGKNSHHVAGTNLRWRYTLSLQLLLKSNVA